MKLKRQASVAIPASPSGPLEETLLVVGLSTHPKWIDDFKKLKVVKVAVPSYDAADTMLAHQCCCMQIVDQISPRFRQLVQALPENGRMPSRRREDA